MSIRSLFPLTAAAGLWLGGLSLAQQPAARPASGNESVVRAVHQQIAANARLRGCKVKVVSVGAGDVELTGKVADMAQRDEMLQAVLSVQGVERVRDGLTVASGTGVMQAQAVPEPTPLSPAAANGPGGVSDPIPVFQPHAAMPYDMNPPRMPPYAWPTYAPYNNYSRVAYPQAYPYNAWPFVGPFYPFPKIPLGWRSVKLEWQDGHWWFGKTATQHDYWRVRYW